jgi:hypothetical protein
MTSRILSFALVTALTVLAPTAVRADDWTTFKAPGNEFQVKLPGEPAVQKQEVATPAGKMKMVTYVANATDTNTILGVVSCALPPALAQQFKDNPELGLDGLIEGMIMGVNGKKTSSREVKMGSNVGREFQASIYGGEGTLVGRVFVIDGTAYMLMVMTPKDQNSKEDATKFFGSFQVNPTHEI